MLFRSLSPSIASVVLVAVGLALCAPAPVAAQGRIANFASFKRVEADPSKRYELTEADGPWLIMAGSFAGTTAAQEAQQLVLELRKRFKLNAYIHSQRFDFSAPVTGRGVDKYGEPKKMKHRVDRAYDEIAVLVGNFPSIDDPQLQQTLKQLKYLQPTCLQRDGKQPSSQRFAGLRAVQRHFNGSAEKRKKGPLGSAFAARNPMLPQEYFTPTGFDSFVAEMNKGVKFSLLKCAKKYSVRVATFRGNVVIDPKEVATIQEKGGMESKLMQAAERAAQLVELLRQRGVEAYEFHDRYESIVTVGSFDQVGTPRQDGKVEIDPQVYKVIKNYGATQEKSAKTAKTELKPKSLGGIYFDLQPIPVEVPTRSIAADYAGKRR